MPEVDPKNMTITTDNEDDTDTDITNADDANDMTTPITDIDPENITKDSDNTKLEAKQVSQEDSSLIEKMYHIIRRYDCLSKQATIFI